MSLQGFCTLTSEATTKEGLSWILQFKEKLVAFCKTYPEGYELFQDVLTEPCPWEGVTRVFRLYEGYDNEKSTENKRKQLCKIIGRFAGCSIGFYTGTSFGKHDYNLIDVMNLSLVSKKLQNYIL